MSCITRKRNESCVLKLLQPMIFRIVMPNQSMSGPRGINSESIFTEHSPRTRRVGQRILAKAKYVHINFITGSDWLPRSRHNNPQNHCRLSKFPNLQKCGCTDAPT